MAARLIQHLLHRHVGDVLNLPLGFPLRQLDTHPLSDEALRPEPRPAEQAEQHHHDAEDDERQDHAAQHRLSFQAASATTSAVANAVMSPMACNREAASGTV